MAINVKKLKRVIVEDEPLKEFNSGDKKPAFRQNGYGLTFDATNSDYLSISTAQTIEDGEKVVWKGIGSALLGYELADTVIQSTSTGLFYRINGSSTTIFTGLVDWTVYNEVTVRRESGINYISILGLGEVSIPETVFFEWDKVNSFTSNEDGFFDCSVISLESKGETFNLSESRGTTTTGSEGTIATINTSNAGGVQYLDSTVWNKKAFGLEFEAANSEYLSGLTASLIDGETIEANFSLVDGSTVSLFGSNLTSFVYIKVTPTLVQIRDTNQGNLNYGASLTIGQKYMLRVVRVADNIEVFIDNVSLGVNATSPLALYTFVQIGRSGGGAVFSNVSIYNFSINSEQFNLTEGLGNEVYGSNGTIGTIHTDALGGIVGSDSNELVFDGANSDYLSIPLDFTINDGMYLEIRAKVFDTVTSVTPLSSGSSNYLTYNVPSDNRLFVSCNGKGNNILPNTIFADTWHTVRLFRDNGSNYAQVDGGTIAPFTNGLNDLFVLNSINLRLNGISTNYQDMEIEYVDFNGNKFNFTEGNGTTTTGSLGTVATINTSHADGSDYVDYQMWDNPIMTPAYRNNYGQWLKNGNVLKFDSVNLDYLEVNSSFVWENVSDISTEFIFNTEITTSNNYLFSVGLYNNPNTGSLFGRITSGGSLQLIVRGKNDVANNIVTSNNVIFGEQNTILIDGLDVYLNSTKIGDFNEDLVEIDSSFNAFKLGISEVGNAFYIGSFNGLILNSEQFQFREGQGITTTGSLGTQATINTANAGGTQYINEQVWNVDSNKYIDYE